MERLLTLQFRTGIITGLWDSAATFKRGTAVKVSFIILSMADLVLTVTAINLGFAELNPFVKYLLNMPVLLIIFKLCIPLLIAWLIPSRLLLPSAALLALVFFWNVKELFSALL